MKTKICQENYGLVAVVVVVLAVAVVVVVEVVVDVVNHHVFVSPIVGIMVEIRHVDHLLNGEVVVWSTQLDVNDGGGGNGR